MDLEKPGQQELEKIRLLQKRHPDLKVIAMSEAFGDEFLRAAEQLGAQATLAKPIRADQLLETDSANGDRIGICIPRRRLEAIRLRGSGVIDHPRQPR